jgi:hypothetical protein
MDDNSEALFVVKLPAGQKLIEYSQIPIKIAIARIQAERPDFDPDKDDTLEPYMAAINWEDKLKEAVDTGLITPLNPLSWTKLEFCIGEMLQQSMVTVADLRKFLAEHMGGVEVAPSLAVVAPIKQTVEQPDQSGKTWKDEARAEADKIHIETTKHGWHLGLEQISEKVAEELRKRGVEGTRGPLTPGNILREALSGGKW